MDPSLHVSVISESYIVNKLHTLITQEALQMQKDRATRHKYEVSYLKRLAIWEWPSTTFNVITIIQLLLLDRPYTSITSS